MRIPFAAAAALLLVCSAAQAEQAPAPTPQPDGDKMSVGIGVICNTTEQAEHYVQLRAGGSEISRAVHAVNQEVQDPRACGLAAIAFQRDKTVETKNVGDRLLSIVRVSVLAGYDGQRWAPVPSMTQYAIMENEGVSI
jgi:hypothetical protein